MTATGKMATMVPRSPSPGVAVFQRSNDRVRGRVPARKIGLVTDPQIITVSSALRGLYWIDDVTAC